VRRGSLCFLSLSLYLQEKETDPLTFIPRTVHYICPQLCTEALASGTVRRSLRSLPFLPLLPLPPFSFSPTLTTPQRTDDSYRRWYRSFSEHERDDVHSFADLHECVLLLPLSLPYSSLLPSFTFSPTPTMCADHQHRPSETMMHATDSLPLNFGFTGKGNDSGPAGLVDQVRNGAIGLKLHEVRFSSPPSSFYVRDSLQGERELTRWRENRTGDLRRQRSTTALRWRTSTTYKSTFTPIRASFHLSSSLSSDTDEKRNRLNEAGFVEDTTAATKGRTISYYHVEGAGGGVRSFLPPLFVGTDENEE
jgi:hypothetical protein